MSRPPSRMSCHHHGSSSSRMRIRRAKSAAPCLMYPPTDEAFQEEWPHGGEDPAAAFFRPHTSFHYLPEELEDDGLVGEVTGQMLGDPTVDCGHDLQLQGQDEDCCLPHDPEPLKIVKKYGYGYRKPDKDLYPHWSQWPQPPTAAPQTHRPLRHMPAATPVYLHTTKHATVGRSVCNPVFNDLQYDPNNMTCRMKYGDERNIIMHRGLSPRRAAPPVMPGRQMTHYGGFGQRDMISSLDLPYQYNPGYSTSRAVSRESRPMHRHMRHQRQDEGYLHNNSIYYSTTPNVSGYFIIHPDWVSERLSMRRSQSLLAF